MTTPKLFISYCWSDLAHEKWVIDLATELRQSGVDVILDKWDLKEGHDAIAFMEKMVTDPAIRKVVMICDEKYSEKADGRAGGVGTETQIISKKVYEEQAQEKFVAVVKQKDESGKPFLPTYYSSRIYIDLSESERYAENFEQLLRWIFDKPLHVKPELGPAPTFLSEGEHISLGTTAMFKRCIDALRNQKPFAAGAFDEYCNVFASNLERFRLPVMAAEIDDDVLKSINDFIPYRNEVIQLFITIAQYSPSTEFVERIHRLFEELIPYTNRPSAVTQYRDWDFDNFKFIVHELFLYALGIFCKHDRIEQAAYLLEHRYYLSGNSDYGRDVLVSFVAFRDHLKSLAHRNARLRLNRLSLRADLLKERCNGSGIEFRFLLQADFIAFMRAEVENENGYSNWWPETLMFLRHSSAPCEIFARSISKTYFDRAKKLIGIDSPKDLEPLLVGYRDGTRKLPKWDYQGFSPAELLGYDKLATRA